MAWSKYDGVLHAAGLRKVHTAADGHCLLHAVRRSWQLQILDTPAPSLLELQSAIFNEAICKSGMYRDFFCDTYIAFKTQMMAYLLNKSFNVNFVDLVPLMICNFYSLNICIVNVDNVGRYSFIDICPSNGKTAFKTIYMHRSFQHYSALELSVPRANAMPYTTEQPVTGSTVTSVTTQNRFSCLADPEEFPPLSTVEMATPAATVVNGDRVKVISTKASKVKVKSCKKNKNVVKSTNLIQITPESKEMQRPSSVNIISETKLQETEKKDVIVIGTSLVRDIGVKLNDQNVNAIVYTHAGCSIQHIAPRFRQMIPSNYNGCIVLQVGGNDCTDNDSESVINKYEAFLNDIQVYAPSAHILVSAIPPRRGSPYLKYKIDSVNDYLHFRSTFDKKVSFIECPLSSTKLHFRNDGVHFSPLGKTIYICQMKKVINQVFQIFAFNKVLR